MTEPKPGLLKRVGVALRRALTGEVQRPLDPDIAAAAERAWLAEFPNRAVRSLVSRMWAEADDHFVVAVSDRNPGVLNFIRVSKTDRVGTFVKEDQMKYRPGGLK